MVTDFKGGAVCLTFDDSRYTDWLAQRELFKKYNAHATFFYSGELTESHIQSAGGRSYGGITFRLSFEL